MTHSFETRPTIAIDAMGHDDGPSAIIEGAIEAAKKDVANIILVGKEGIIGPMLNDKEAPSSVQVRHTHDAFAMGEAKHPRDIRDRPDASVVVAASMVANGDADIMMSAGDTAASVMAGRRMIGKAPGVKQPVIASTIPGIKHPTLLLDTGASRTTEMTPEQALERAELGEQYYRQAIDDIMVRYGVFNIGEEAGKGSPELIEVQQVLQQHYQELFAGNVQGNDIFPNQAGEGDSSAHVVVASGFTGNVFLKTTKGALAYMKHHMKAAAEKNWLNRLAGGLFKVTVGKEVSKNLDYERYASSPLLGLKKPVTILHGSSSAKAVEHGIYNAKNIIKPLKKQVEAA